ncbi:Na+/H+ antiporter NhaA [Zwartia vadi]|uniref:Na+/H+ antiporter NhaA n=1 Tax=Zwartia vadi TaxID=3058168 RepID=UPI0025B59095|nr:Na+/H+ antiporter NhaA [Zwartia vadi]MDN3987881.1 Na+/H+ antiporter NhaA [Zwartia vadi]
MAGIGFTMSIFITNLAFSNQTEMINPSKFAILIASQCSGVLGYIWLILTSRKTLHTDTSG